MGRSKRSVRFARRSSSIRHLVLTVEALESRTVPYAAIGAWPHPELVTISFMPDGTYLGGALSSNLFASFNARWPTAVWQEQILLAAQTWAQYTNLNFALVPDAGLPLGAGSCQQGDPQEGDIRIGGFNFGSSDVGAAWFPPPANNYAAAGDVFLNTGQPFNIGSTYDLFTVATHELGHALGLLHSDDYYAAMYANYVGVKSYGLTWDDVAGIRSLYSGGAPRAPDGFGLSTSTFQTAADLTGAFEPVTQPLVGAFLDITYPGQAEYYRFLAPNGTSAQLTVTIQSSGLSLLAPAVVLYDASQQPIAAASGSGQFGTTISVSVGGVAPGELFWLRVSGAEVSPLGIGRYALIVNFGPSLSPTVSPANTFMADGVPTVGIGGWPQEGAANSDGRGFDTFDARSDEVAHPTQDGATPRFIRNGTAPASLTVTEVVQWVHPLSEQAGQALLLASAMPGAPPTLPLLPPPLLDAPAPKGAYARIESGGANDGAECVEEDPPTADTVPSLPNRDPSVYSPQVGILPSPTAKWRAACTAYFALDNASGRRPRLRAACASALATSAPLRPGSASALLGLTLVLGGYWGSQPEAPRERKTPWPRGNHVC